MDINSVLISQVLQHVDIPYHPSVTLMVGMDGIIVTRVPMNDVPIGGADVSQTSKKTRSNRKVRTPDVTSPHFTKCV